ncbi:hypothetical protein U9M48_005350 [Paspalum notatum var. saurae]|uniref:Saccharopine dehydrogenase NADP binding domain-containing protein n=1 Tax=Paspalum notatum var. saurae TaxID=547442 RepID=A0AAQ3SLD3_PASNO
MAAMGTVRACAPPAAAASSTRDTAPAPQRMNPMKSSKSGRVLVIGGTGRVGGSTAAALSKLRPDLSILAGGRNREKGESFAAKLGEQSEFVQVDTRSASMLEKALQGRYSVMQRNTLLLIYPVAPDVCVDLVVHTAGPFQRAEECTVLQAAISTKAPYIDVCDDLNYSWRAKGFHEQAKTAGVPAITTAGICPGVSNVMAAELVRAARSENGEPERLRFFYYTAGTGGAGPTILTTSFLLLGEDVIAYNKGEEIKLKPYSGSLSIDFGKGVRKKNVYLLNLPEVKSAFKILGVPTVSARLGTAPSGIGECRFGNPRAGMDSFCAVDTWHTCLDAILNLRDISLRFSLITSHLGPIQEFLRDKNNVQKLVESVDPLVRAVDGIAGEHVSMRVDLDCSNGQNTIRLFTHKKLFVSVGFATAAFALTVLEGNTQPGVWFPEEPEGIPMEARELLLERASEGTSNFVMNKPSWMVETDPKEVGLGLYV